MLRTASTLRSALVASCCPLRPRVLRCAANRSPRLRVGRTRGRMPLTRMILHVGSCGSVVASQPQGWVSAPVSVLRRPLVRLAPESEAEPRPPARPARDESGQRSRSSEPCCSSHDASSVMTPSRKRARSSRENHQRPPIRRTRIGLRPSRVSVGGCAQWCTATALPLQGRARDAPAGRTVSVSASWTWRPRCARTADGSSPGRDGQKGGCASSVGRDGQLMIASSATRSSASKASGDASIGARLASTTRSASLPVASLRRADVTALVPRAGSRRGRHRRTPPRERTHSAIALEERSGRPVEARCVLGVDIERRGTAARRRHGVPTRRRSACARRGRRDHRGAGGGSCRRSPWRVDAALTAHGREAVDEPGVDEEAELVGDRKCLSDVAKVLLPDPRCSRLHPS